MAESIFRKIESFRSYKDILQCIMTRAIWQRHFSSVQFSSVHILTSLIYTTNFNIILH
jgi:hypothetical protein